MTAAGKSLGVLFGSVIAACAPAQTPPAALPAMPAMPAPMAAMPARINLAEVVDPAHRDAVVKVVRQPTLSARSASEPVACTPELYEWFLDHPDRVALAWRRLKVPCVEITDLGGGKFAWAEDGSELVWSVVGRFPGGVVWYATGKVKPSAVTPTVPVRAVVVMTFPARPGADGSAAVTPGVQAFVHTDSRAANTLLRVLGPTAPKLAEQGAEQLLYFFNGLARYVDTHPDKAEALLAPPKK